MSTVQLSPALTTPDGCKLDQLDQRSQLLKTAPDYGTSERLNGAFAPLLFPDRGTDDPSCLYGSEPSDSHPMLFYYWASVTDGGPILKQHWVNLLCVLEVSNMPRTTPGDRYFYGT